MREVDLGSGRALLIKEHGEFSAIAHKCPHYGAPLVKGPHSCSRDTSIRFIIIYKYLRVNGPILHHPV